MSQMSWMSQASFVVETLLVIITVEKSWRDQRKMSELVRE